VKEISTKQFIVSEIALALGMGLVLCPGGLALSLATLLICASGFIMMTRAERSHPLASRDIVWIVATLLAFAVLVTAAKHFLSHDAVAPSIRFLRHPAFLLTIWIFITWRGYRKWRHAKPTTNAS
jgi:ribose/xylose/arabinose/galactoside ABC-type transport system permease subunit